MTTVDTEFEDFLGDLWGKLTGRTPAAPGKVYGPPSPGLPQYPPSGTESAMLRSAIRGGETNENALADLVFFRRHPERNGRLISRDEPNFAQLSSEWLTIRDTLVRPLLRGTPTTPSVPVPGSGTGPAAPDVVSAGGITVARRIAPQVSAMVAAAAADGVVLRGGGFRTPDQQIALRRKNCGPSQYDIFEKSPSQCSPMTARPGTSNHEKGLAIDFQRNGAALTQADPEFRWLAANAHRFGLINLPKEPWHWSVDGK